MIASGGIHLLLLVILLVGPAFFSGKPPVDDSKVLEFIPIITTYDKMEGGGDNTVKQLPAKSETPAPAPAPAPEPPKPAVQKEPELPKPAPKPAPQPKPEPVKKESDSLEVSTAKKPKVSLTRVKRSSVQNNAKARAEREAREAANAQRELAQRLNRAVSGIRNGLSSSTEIRLKGPGGGGVPYANFFDAVKTVYARAWRVPDDATDDTATAVAAVVIAKDGRVVSARIIQSSGNAVVDRSVRTTLDNVKFVVPLPASETASQREVTINFNVRAAKLLMG